MDKEKVRVLTEEETEKVVGGSGDCGGCGCGANSKATAADANENKINKILAETNMVTKA